MCISSIHNDTFIEISYSNSLCLSTTTQRHKQHTISVTYNVVCKQRVPKGTEWQIRIDSRCRLMDQFKTVDYIIPFSSYIGVLAICQCQTTIYSTSKSSCWMTLPVQWRVDDCLACSLTWLASAAALHCFKQSAIISCAAKQLITRISDVTLRYRTEQQEYN